MTEDGIKETFLYKDCLVKCASVELKLNIASELKYAFDNYKGYAKFRTNEELLDAFTWRSSPQGRKFWGAINAHRLPEGYE